MLSVCKFSDKVNKHESYEDPSRVLKKLPGVFNDVYFVFFTGKKLVLNATPLKMRLLAINQLAPLEVIAAG